AASRVSTYAYVNPIVAVFLGWAMAGEALTGRVLVAVLLLVVAVLLITRFGDSRRQRTWVPRTFRPGVVFAAFVNSMDRPATSLMGTLPRAKEREVLGGARRGGNSHGLNKPPQQLEEAIRLSEDCPRAEC
ncbi:MAG: hypothetical protein ACI84D_003303, partial [Thalassolituus oleivorans]